MLDLYVARAGLVSVDLNGIFSVYSPATIEASVGTVDTPLTNSVAITPTNNRNSLLATGSNESLSYTATGTGQHVFNAPLLANLASYSGTWQTALRPNASTTSNRMAYWSMTGNGNFTGYQEWGVNGVVGNVDAARVMRLNQVGLLIGNAGTGANAPVHVINATDTASRQAGISLQSSPAGAGKTLPGLNFIASVGPAGSVDSVREGAGFGHTLRFWTPNNSNGVEFNWLSLNSSGQLTGTATWNAAPIGSNYGGAGTINGLLKANGAGVVSQANPGSDYAKVPLTATATLDFGSIAAAASEDLTITVAGAVIGYSTTYGLPASPTAGITWTSFVSAADTVTIRATNITASAVDPASATYRATVFVP